MRYAIKFRQQVLKVRVARALSVSHVASLLGLYKQTVYDGSKQLEPRKRSRHGATKIELDALADAVNAFPDAYSYAGLNVLKSVQVACFMRADA